MGRNEAILEALEREDWRPTIRKSHVSNLVSGFVTLAIGSYVISTLAKELKQ